MSSHVTCLAFMGNSGSTPLDLSFLTNRASFASWALKQVDEIDVTLTASSAGAPDDWPSTRTNKSFAYNGKPSLTAMAKSLTGVTFTLNAAIPNSFADVSINLKNTLPDGNKQYLFSGAVGGKPVYDGKSWVLPKDASTPSMNLSGSIFIPVPGLVKAWVVETNSQGWTYKKSLPVWINTGLYFDVSECGEITLCFEVADEDSTHTQFVYDLHGSGQRMPMPTVIALISLKGDSQDVREDYGDNPTMIGHWVYTYKPDYSELTYGTVPLLVVNYTKETNATVYVGSSVGYARSFAVTRIADGPGQPEIKFNFDLPAGQNYLNNVFKPGLYHIVPLGIPVCADWWKIGEVDGWSGGGGKGIAPIVQ